MSNKTRVNVIRVNFGRPEKIYDQEVETQISPLSEETGNIPDNLTSLNDRALEYFEQNVDLDYKGNNRLVDDTMSQRLIQAAKERAGRLGKVLERNLGMEHYNYSKKELTAFGALVLSVVGLAGVGAISRSGKESIPASIPTEAVPIKVHTGDNLTSLVKEVNPDASLGEISKEANRIKAVRGSELIRPGEEIQIRVID